MSQVIPQKPLRVVVWSTGTIGRHAIAGVDAHPDLELVGVWVSNPDKHGKDAGVLAELGRELGVPATNYATTYSTGHNGGTLDEQNWGDAPPPPLVGAPQANIFRLKGRCT